MDPRLPQVFITPGSIYCAPEPTVITTILGSCIAICLRDSSRKIGGMNHYALPIAPAESRSLRYGDVAIEALLHGMMRLGSRRIDLRASIFGGANVLPFDASRVTVGTRNLELANRLLRERNIPVVTRQVGGSHGRFIRFHTATGQVDVRKVENASAA